MKGMIKGFLLVFMLVMSASITESLFKLNLSAESFCLTKLFTESLF